MWILFSLLSVLIYVAPVIAIACAVHYLVQRNRNDTIVFPMGQDGRFMQALEALQVLVAQARQYQQWQQSGQGIDKSLPPQLQTRFQRLLLQAREQMTHIDQLSRDRHDVFVSGMLSDATSAGLDVSGWNIR